MLIFVLAKYQLNYTCLFFKKDGSISDWFRFLIHFLSLYLLFKLLIYRGRSCDSQIWNNLISKALENNVFLPRKFKHYSLWVVLLEHLTNLIIFSSTLDLCASDIVPLIEEYFLDRNVCSFFFSLLLPLFNLLTFPR